MKRLAILLAGFIALIATPVFAITNPTSVTVDNFHATSNVLQTGDLLITAEYNIVYATTPNETIDEAFIFRLIDTDGSTELGRVLAYPYVTRGYGKGVISFYFNAASAPGTDQYIVRVTGNPAVFPTFAAQEFTMPASAYTAYSADPDTDIRQQVLLYANHLNDSYEAVIGASLISSSSGASPITLSSYGEIYFSNAITNLLNMSPSLFYERSATPNATVSTYNTTQADAYKNRFAANWVGDSQAAFGEIFNTDMQVAMGLIAFLLCALWGIAVYLTAGKIEGAYLIAGNTLLGSTVLGWISMAFMSVIIFICAVYIGFIVIYKGVQQ